MLQQYLYAAGAVTVCTKSSGTWPVLVTLNAPRPPNGSLTPANNRNRTGPLPGRGSKIQTEPEHIVGRINEREGRPPSRTTIKKALEGLNFHWIQSRQRKIPPQAPAVRISVRQDCSIFERIRMV